MNKLFSKIAALSVGLAMAVGVGVAVGHEAVREVRAENTPTPITDLVTGDTVVIVGQSGDKTYAMTNNNGTASN